MNIDKSWFQANKFKIELTLLFLYFTINGLINASSNVMESMRSGDGAFSPWEPFVWELSSAYTSMALIPLIALFSKYYRWDWQQPSRTILKYMGMALTFCILHVSGMVIIREFVYAFTDSEYRFATDLASLLFEFIYEARKDVWSFFFFVLAIEAYRYAISQWLGNITPIFESSTKNDQEQAKTLPEVLLVKKMGKEFLIKSKEVQWAESSGNYLNLHVNNAVYPMRITMSEFAQQAAIFGFIRTHRSQIVNSHHIKHIEKQASGDSSITLQDGTCLKLSRRYKKDFDEYVKTLSAESITTK